MKRWSEEESSSETDQSEIKGAKLEDVIVKSGLPVPYGVK